MLWNAWAEMMTLAQDTSQKLTGQKKIKGQYNCKGRNYAERTNRGYVTGAVAKWLKKKEINDISTNEVCSCWIKISLQNRENILSGLRGELSEQSADGTYDMLGKCWEAKAAESRGITRGSVTATLNGDRYKESCRNHIWDGINDCFLERLTRKPTKGGITSRVQKMSLERPLSKK